MTAVLGLDLGSRRTKAVLVEKGTVVERAVFQAWAFDRAAIARWVEARQAQIARLGATGYARQAAAAQFGAEALTEIRAFGRGAAVLVPGARTVVDIGGQDAKAIALAPGGQVEAFEMNDRCAAGTGKFFELLAATLGLDFTELDALALAAAEAAPITSTCAVFAESEIVGRLAEGAAPGVLARGVFRAVAERLAAMLHRVGFGSPAWLVGGGATACLARELGACLGLEFRLHPDGAFFGAVGAAVAAAPAPAVPAASPAAPAVPVTQGDPA
ncbi:MAG: CoA enzyme activase [Candidatus Ozemobacter sibiricus]|jgi:predicted CoA-substrate-specific enzyme activase|uniref:CoA enzyme activase n=1 Tax=Candidatus Ozemobacter sibiricus TaxID=2268124 RepID=A0A367ZR68_9BACT|nr:MAG: CoA enzyme activase [Candidatus Ozemobacter sibiricus]